MSTNKTRHYQVAHLLQNIRVVTSSYFLPIFQNKDGALNMYIRSKIYKSRLVEESKSSDVRLFSWGDFVNDKQQFLILMDASTSSLENT